MQEPDFTFRRHINADDLLRLDEPAVIREYSGVDSDGVRFFAFSVAGWLDGSNVANIHGGALVGGQVMLINADSQDEADEIAGLGLQSTIEDLRREQDKHLEAQVALARLEAIGPVRRLELGIAKSADKSDAFERDMAAIATLRGTDIALSAGKVEAPTGVDQ